MRNRPSLSFVADFRREKALMGCVTCNFALNLIFSKLVFNFLQKLSFNVVFKSFANQKVKVESKRFCKYSRSKMWGWVP